jgi:hypothetical protein
MKNGFYKHYKGGKVDVIDIAHHSETLEELVVYRALYECRNFGMNSLWVRPKKMFFEEVVVDGKKLPRFEYMGDFSEEQKKDQAKLLFYVGITLLAGSFFIGISGAIMSINWFLYFLGWLASFSYLVLAKCKVTKILIFELILLIITYLLPFLYMSGSSIPCDNDGCLFIWLIPVFFNIFIIAILILILIIKLFIPKKSQFK